MQKIEILDLLKDGVSTSEVGHWYSVNESTICSIKNSEHKIRQSVRADVSTKLTCVSQHPVLEKIEKLLDV